MIRSLVFIFVLLFSTNSFAISGRDLDGAGFSDLNDAQKAEILKQIAETKQSNKSAPIDTAVLDKAAAVVPSAEKVDSWVTTGEHLGKALSAAAKEVGTAVNEFIKTPVGEMVMFLIFWNMFGAAILPLVIHIILSVLILTGSWYMAYYIGKRGSCEEIEYDTEKLSWRGKPLVKKFSRQRLSEEQLWGIWLTRGIGLLFSVIALDTYH